MISYCMIQCHHIYPAHFIPGSTTATPKSEYLAPFFTNFSASKLSLLMTVKWFWIGSSLAEEKASLPAVDLRKHPSHLLLAHHPGQNNLWHSRVYKRRCQMNATTRQRRTDASREDKRHKSETESHDRMHKPATLQLTPCFALFWEAVKRSSIQQRRLLMILLLN